MLRLVKKIERMKVYLGAQACILIICLLTLILLTVILFLFSVFTVCIYFYSWM